MVQPQPTGLSPTFSPVSSPVKVLGAGVGGTQINGVQFIQSHAPLVQPTAVIPKGSKSASKQETNEPSFSKMLIKKGKTVPEKINIAKIQKQPVDPVVNVPQIHVMPPTPLETIVARTTTVDMMAEPIIEQPDQKAPEVAAVNTPEPQTTDSSESAENCMPVDTSLVEDSKEVTILEETTAEDAETEVGIEPSTDTEPAEPKEDPKQEQLEDDIPITNVSTSTNIEESAKELLGSEPLVDDKISEIIQANDPIELTATEPGGLESNKDLETAIEESQEDKPELNSQEAATDQDVVDDKDTEQEEPSPSTLEDVPVCPENDLQETKASQDPEVTKDLAHEAEQTPETVEEKGVPLADGNNLQENIDSQELKTAEDISEPVEIQEPAVNDGEEILANQNEEPSESPVEEISENVDENVNQPENSEQLDTESTDSPQEETLVLEDNFTDAEQADQPMDTIAPSEEVSFQEDQPIATSEEEDTSTQEDASSSVQEDDVEPKASTQSTPVMELSSNEEDECLDDIEAQTQDVEESTDLSVEARGEQPEEDQDNDESSEDSVEEIERTDNSVDSKDSSKQSDPEISEENIEDLVATAENNNTPPPNEPSDETVEEKEQPIVEEGAEEACPSLEETDEASLGDKEAILEEDSPLKEEDVASDNEDADGKAGSMSDQEQIPTEDNVKDEESPVENQDCNLEEDVQNGGTNEEPETLENPPNDQNVEEKPPVSEEV